MAVGDTAKAAVTFRKRLAACSIQSKSVFPVAERVVHYSDLCVQVCHCSKKKKAYVSFSLPLRSLASFIINNGFM